MGKDIMIVDDSATVRSILAKTLVLAKVPIHTLHEAANGVEALQILAETNIDLILTDINMPVMDGVEMIRRLRAIYEPEELPVILITTDGTPSLLERLKCHGITAYIRKPFTPEQIRAVVQTAIGEPHV